MFVVELIIDGERKLFGPFTTEEKGLDWIERFRQNDKDETYEFGCVMELNPIG